MTEDPTELYSSDICHPQISQPVAIYSPLGSECGITCPLSDNTSNDVASVHKLCDNFDTLAQNSVVANAESICGYDDVQMSDSCSIEYDMSVCMDPDFIESSIGQNDFVSGDDDQFSYYDCSNVIPVCPMSVRLQPRHHIGTLESQMNAACWDYYLGYEDDIFTRDYLSKSIHFGFDIVDDYAPVPSYNCHNYSSVCSGPAHDYVSKIIQQEIIEGKYIRADYVPHCVHALGAVPKSDNTFRPITDCRRPIGQSINNFMNVICDDFSYCSVDDVAASMTEGCYMASVDIASAYRSMSVNPDHWTYQGVSWNLNDSPEYLMDTRMCFGLKCAPFQFTKVSNFVKDTMTRMGYKGIINYLDDFLVFGNTFQECQQAQVMLVTLLGQLGFNVSWKKCSSPSRSTRYLGIIFDSVDMCLILPDDKIDKLRSELKFFEKRSRATKRQLQRLCGILSYSAKVIKGARTFSRRVIDLLKKLPEGNPRIRLTTDFRYDMEWWDKCASSFNGYEYIIKRNEGDGPVFYTDSSLTGYGMVTSSDWIAGFYNSEDTPVFACDSCQDYHWFNVQVPLDSDNINYLELIPVYIGILRLAPLWRNHHMLCYSDNTQVVSMINRGTSANSSAMH